MFSAWEPSAQDAYWCLSVLASLQDHAVSSGFPFFARLSKTTIKCDNKGISTDWQCQMMTLRCRCFCTEK
ncbi:hypothetical protein M5D96_007039, partial [Drosophila gunungcola]